MLIGRCRLASLDQPPLIGLTCLVETFLLGRSLRGWFLGKTGLALISAHAHNMVRKPQSNKIRAKTSPSDVGIRRWVFSA